MTAFNWTCCGFFVVDKSKTRPLALHNVIHYIKPQPILLNHPRLHTQANVSRYELKWYTLALVWILRLSTLTVVGVIDPGRTALFWSKSKSLINSKNSSELWSCCARNKERKARRHLCTVLTAIFENKNPSCLIKFTICAKKYKVSTESDEL